MGTILGLGFALVACVGGYALGALSFPLLEDDTATPQVRVAPNETEVALQALAAQQTLEAANQVLSTDIPTESGVNVTDTAATTGDGGATTDAAATVAPTGQAVAGATATPSPLPTANTGAAAADATGTGTDSASGNTQQDAPAVLNPTATMQPDQPAAQVEALAQGTAAVGTQPAGEPTEAIGLPQAPAVPPELDASKSETVLVTGGSFQMGTTLEEGMAAMEECSLYGKTCADPNLLIADSIPPHNTTVDNFEMEVYEVSLQQYVTFLNWLGPNEHSTGCGGNPCLLTTQEDENSLVEFDGTTYSIRNPGFYSNHPVSYVTWWGAQEYCRTLDRRLPTEAEWERAARGEQNYIYPWGFEYDTERAMSSLPADAGTQPVDSYPTGASPYGIYNMAGNVSEWVYDWYQADYYNQLANSPQPNPRGPTTGTERVIRGGSWDTIPLFLRTVHRMSQQPDNPVASIGFRCVADTAGASPVTSPVTSQAGTSSDAAASGGAPTMAPAPTQAPRPTATVPAGPTATLAPG